MSEANGNIIFIVVIGTILFLFLAMFIFSFFVLHMRRSRNFRDEKSKLLQSFQEELLRSQLEIQEQTFDHVSQEIHDNIGQVLTLARLNITDLCMKEGTVDERLENVKQLIGKAIGDLRNLSKTLNRDYFADRGLVESIKTEVEIVRKSGQHTISFYLSGDPPGIQAQIELILFRIFQEALNNTIKHSGATEIIVRLSFLSDHVSMEVVDNGKGFDYFMELQMKSKDEGGIGIRSMQKRAKLIGADLQFESSSTIGTKVKISCPLQ